MAPIPLRIKRQRELVLSRVAVGTCRRREVAIQASLKLLCVVAVIGLPLVGCGQTDTGEGGGAGGTAEWGGRGVTFSLDEFELMRKTFPNAANPRLFVGHSTTSKACYSSRAPIATSRPFAQSLHTSA